ncbi:hypothetical protein [Streptomyces sp. 891-h]|uniref:hypothetical protein n=1 Tax=Streptomyces sp. 891-h TaxID=2720714 RepID=UPI001FA9D85E|nr:hypothetical protein [Streptomyces sp. 891-h]UNZ21227.1 hypothetical protein HC362_33275 [Streptomyces sp. 891-h]
MTDPADNLVPSPVRADLQRLRDDVALQQETIATSLDRAAQDMAEGGVWEGPTAEIFGEEIEGRKTDVHRYADEVLAAVDAQLSVTPELIPLSDARAYRKMT